MIAAQDYRDHPGVVDLFHPFAYLLVALLDVSGDDGDVAVVDDREVLEDRDVLGGVVGPKEVRDAPYPLGTEAGPRAEGGAGVEGRAHDGGVGVVEVLRVGQPHEGPDARKARRLEGISRLVVGHVRLLLSLAKTRPAAKPRNVDTSVTNKPIATVRVYFLEATKTAQCYKHINDYNPAEPSPVSRGPRPALR